MSICIKCVFQLNHGFCLHVIKNSSRPYRTSSKRYWMALPPISSNSAFNNDANDWHIWKSSTRYSAGVWAWAKTRTRSSRARIGECTSLADSKSTAAKYSGSHVSFGTIKSKEMRALQNLNTALLLPLRARRMNEEAFTFGIIGVLIVKLRGNSEGDKAQRLNMDCSVGGNLVFLTAWFLSD